MVLVRWNGIEGVAAGFAVGSVAGMVAMQLAVKLKLDMALRSFILAALPAGVGGALGVVMVCILPLTGWAASLAFAGTVGLLAYGGSAVLMRQLASR